MNFQIFLIIFSFMRELFFDKKEEADFKSKHFKPKRWIAFFFTVITFSASIFMSMRLVQLAKDYTALKASVSDCVVSEVKKPVLVTSDDSSPKVKIK
jgi:hypothetical protein